MTLGSIFEAAKEDPRLKKLVDEALDMIALSVGNLITATNPDIVVIGGRAARNAPVAYLLSLNWGVSTLCLPSRRPTSRSYLPNLAKTPGLWALWLSVSKA